MKLISVLLVDDHVVVRQGLRVLLEAENDIEVVGEAENGREGVALARKTLPNIVLMDLAMPILDGLEASRQMLKISPSIKVLVLTSYEDDHYVQTMVDAGVSGYLIKQTAASDLLTAIRAVRQGGTFYSPAISRRQRLIEQRALDSGTGTKRGSSLTSREAEVLQLIAEGFTNKSIAGELSISIKTVEKHRQQVMNKLNIHETAGLTRYWLSRGAVERQIPGSATV